MKKNLLCALILLVSVPLLHAQKDRWVPSFGYMYEYYAGMETDSLIAGNQQLPLRAFSAVNVSGYYVLAQKNDIISVGVMPGITFAIRPKQSVASLKLTSDLLVQVPVYIMARAGAMSTSYNQQKIGLGVGIGGSFSHYSVVNQYSATDEETIRLQYFEPQVIGEFVFNLGRGNITLRGHFGPVPMHSRFTLIQDVKTSLSADLYNYGFGIIYGL